MNRLHKYNLFIVYYSLLSFAGIAQLVEQWIEDPRVTSSSLVLGILNRT